LGTQMKSVGEAMAIGRTFPEALQKAARSLEIGRDGLSSFIGLVDYRTLSEDPNLTRDLLMDAPREPAAPKHLPSPKPEELRIALEKLVAAPSADRLFYVADAIRLGIPEERLFALTSIDPWFLRQIARIVEEE